MKKLAFGTFAVAALLGAGSALAADLPEPAYKAPPIVAAYSWTGYYIGANAGYSFGRESNDWFLFGFPAAQERQNLNGAIAGVQSGFNWQIGNQWVVGYESDIQWSGQRGSSTFCVLTCAILAVNADHRLPWFGTARSRAGVLVTPNILLYGTYGVAYGETRADYTLNVLNVPVAAESFRNTRAGWTAGAGVEGAVGGGWSIKAEYLYIDLGRSSVSASAFGAPVFQINNRVTDNIARLGVNYKFGGDAPLVTRY
jgi:outer membrane immunogenic protein